MGSPILSFFYTLQKACSTLYEKAIPLPSMFHDGSLFPHIYDNPMIQSITQLRKISLSQLVQQARK